MKRVRVAVVVVGIALTWAALVPLARAMHAPRVSVDRARDAALARVEGNVVAEHCARTDGHWTYRFDVRPRGDDAAQLVEVSVDADDGAVIGVERAGAVARGP